MQPLKNQYEAETIEINIKQSRRLMISSEVWISLVALYVSFQFLLLKEFKKIP